MIGQFRVIASTVTRFGSIPYGDLNLVCSLQLCNIQKWSVAVERNLYGKQTLTTVLTDMITNTYFNQIFHVHFNTSFVGNTEEETSVTVRGALAIPLLTKTTIAPSRRHLM